MSLLFSQSPSETLIPGTYLRERLLRPRSLCRQTRPHRCVFVKFDASAADQEDSVYARLRR
jgi:hypothetical protein